MGRFPASHVKVHRLYEVQCETCNEMVGELLHDRAEADRERLNHIEQHRADEALYGSPGGPVDDGHWLGVGR